MALPRTPSASSWHEEVAEGMREEYTATIDVLEPGARGSYDPKSDSRSGAGAGTVVIAERPASIRAAGWPSDQSGAYEWGSKRRYRIQFDAHPDDPIFHAGMIVRVSDGGSDALLEALTFQVVASNGSSHSNVRILYATTEFGGAK